MNDFELGFNILAACVVAGLSLTFTVGSWAVHNLLAELFASTLSISLTSL